MATTTKALGDEAEAQALAFLQAAGLRLVARNFRTPGRGGGEIDLIMREPARATPATVGGEATLVFVEVRRRRHARFGGAAASVSATKQRRIVFAAQHFLSRMGRGNLHWQPPPCRFDVVTLEPGAAEPVQWLRGAFDASGSGWY